MGEWLTSNVWAIWLTLAFLLATAEALTLDLTLLMIAAGALAGAGVALIAPGLWALQIIVAVVVAFAMLAFLRPTLLRRVRDAPGYRSSLDRMLGATGVVTRQITQDGGEVKVHGETWSARPYQAGMVIQPGDEVEVFELEGVTLVVYPKNQALGPGA